MSWVWNKTKQFVGDTIEWIGDTIEDIGEFLVDEIIEPVTEFVGDFVEGFFEDPLKALAKVAAIATGQTWALPLIDGAAVVLDGGSFEDGLKAAGASYIAQGAGQAVSTYASATSAGMYMDANFSETTNKLFLDAITAEGANVATNVIYGEDPFENFGAGLLTAGATKVTSQIMGYVDTKFDTFKDIPEAAQNTLSDAIEATLQGKEITSDVLAGAISRTYVTSETVGQVFSYLPDSVEGALTSRPELYMTLTASTAQAVNMAAGGASGAQVAKAFENNFSLYGQQKLGSMFDEGGSLHYLTETTLSDITTGKLFTESYDRLTGAHQATELAAVELGNTYELVNSKLKEREALASTANVDIQAYETAKANYERAIREKNSIYDVKTASNAYVAAMETLAASQSSGGPISRLLALDAEIGFYTVEADAEAGVDFVEGSGLLADLETQQNTYLASLDDLKTSRELLDAELTPIQDALTEVYVETLNPDFDVDFYKKINADVAGINSDIDAYNRYLAIDSKAGVATNQAEYDAKKDIAATQVADVIATASGMPLSKMTDSERASFVNDIKNNVLPEFTNSQGMIDTKLLESVSATPGTINFGVAATPDAKTTTTAQQDAINSAIDNTKTTYASKVTAEFGASPTYNMADIAVLNSQGFNVDPAKLGEPITEATQLTALLGNSRDVNVTGVTSTNAASIISGQSAFVLDLITGDYKPTEFNNIESWDPNKGTTSTASTGQTIDNLDGQSYFNVMEDVINSAKSAGGAVFDTVDNLISIESVERTLNYIQTNQKYPWVIDAAANSLRAGVGVVQAYNDMTVYFLDADPNSTFAQNLEKLEMLGEDYNSEEYKNSVRAIKDEFNKDISKTVTDPHTGEVRERTWAETTAAKAANMWGGVKQAPVTAAMEFLGVEGLQEVVPWVVGGVVAKGALGGVKAVKTLTAAQAATITSATGLSTSAALNVMEAMGASAGGAYDEVYAATIERLNKQNEVYASMGSSVIMTQEQIEHMADDAAFKVAQKVGKVAGIAAGATLGLGALQLDKFIFGSKKGGNAVRIEAVEQIVDRVKLGGNITVREGVTESIEEGVSQLALATELHKIDPKTNVIADVAGAAILGGVIGGTISGGIYGSTAFRQLNANPFDTAINDVAPEDLDATIKSYGSADPLANIINNFSPTISNIANDSANAATMQDTLVDLGIDTTTATILTNDAFNSDVLSRDEVIQRFELNNYTPTNAEIERYTTSNKDVLNSTTLETTALTDSYIYNRPDNGLKAMLDGINNNDFSIYREGFYEYTDAERGTNNPLVWNLQGMYNPYSGLDDGGDTIMHNFAQQYNNHNIYKGSTRWNIPYTYMLFNYPDDYQSFTDEGTQNPDYAEHPIYNKSSIHLEGQYFDRHLEYVGKHSINYDSLAYLMAEDDGSYSDTVSHSYNVRPDLDTFPTTFAELESLPSLGITMGAVDWLQMGIGVNPPGQTIGDWNNVIGSVYYDEKTKTPYMLTNVQTFTVAPDYVYGDDWSYDENGTLFRGTPEYNEQGNITNSRRLLPEEHQDERYGLLNYVGMTNASYRESFEWKPLPRTLPTTFDTSIGLYSSMGGGLGNYTPVPDGQGGYDVVWSQEVLDMYAQSEADYAADQREGLGKSIVERYGPFNTISDFMAAIWNDHYNDPLDYYGRERGEWERYNDATRAVQGARQLMIRSIAPDYRRISEEDALALEELGSYQVSFANATIQGEDVLPNNQISIPDITQIDNYVDPLMLSAQEIVDAAATAGKTIDIRYAESLAGTYDTDLFADQTQALLGITNIPTLEADSQQYVEDNFASAEQLEEQRVRQELTDALNENFVNDDSPAYSTMQPGHVESLVDWYMTNRYDLTDLDINANGVAQAISDEDIKRTLAKRLGITEPTAEQISSYRKTIIQGAAAQRVLSDADIATDIKNTYGTTFDTDSYTLAAQSVDDLKNSNRFGHLFTDLDRSDPSSRSKYGPDGVSRFIDQGNNIQNLVTGVAADGTLTFKPRLTPREDNYFDLQTVTLSEAEDYFKTLPGGYDWTPSNAIKEIIGRGNLTEANLATDADIAQLVDDTTITAEKVRDKMSENPTDYGFVDAAAVESAYQNGDFDQFVSNFWVEPQGWDPSASVSDLETKLKRSTNSVGDVLAYLNEQGANVSGLNVAQQFPDLIGLQSTVDGYNTSGGSPANIANNAGVSTWVNTVKEFTDAGYTPTATEVGNIITNQANVTDFLDPLTVTETEVLQFLADELHDGDVSKLTNEEKTFARQYENTDGSYSEQQAKDLLDQTTITEAEATAYLASKGYDNVSESLINQLTGLGKNEASILDPQIPSPGDYGPLLPEGSTFDILQKADFEQRVREVFENIDGIEGVDGASAYDIAVADGYTGSATEWLATLKGEAGEAGEAGKSAFEIAQDGGYTGDEAQWLASLEGAKGAQGDRGPKGAKGDAGEAGADGASAYDLAVNNGYDGTFNDWLDSLVGETGKSAFEIAQDGGYLGSESDWIKSLAGTNGTNGVDGINGVDGASAYDIAVADGYTGSATEWLDSLVGATGKSAFELAQDGGYLGSEAEWIASLQGARGERGYRGYKGEDGTNGIDGINGVDGASAYDLAVADGYTGSLTEWLASLEGDTGKSAFEIAQDNGYTGDEAQWIASLKGAKGETGKDGIDGINGVDGASAYDIAVANGYTGSATEWLASLVGDTGKSAFEIAQDGGYTGDEATWLTSLVGARGPRGYRGFKGEAGIDGINGIDGASAYDLAKDDGYTGSLTEWLASLVGETGKSAFEIAQDNGYIGDEAQWIKSLVGQAGKDGVDGVNGVDGASAYDIAVADGYTGSATEWLASLAGAEGKSAFELAQDGGYTGNEAQWLASLQGAKGERGERGLRGFKGEDGIDGINGADGASAYDIAVADGYTGSLNDWLNSLVGETGKSAFEIAQDNGYDGSEADWIRSLAGTNGTNGVDGINGVDGASAYDIAVADGYTGSATEWLASLIGQTGETGETGKSAFEIAQDGGYTGDEATWLTSLVGARGPRGYRGYKGEDGVDGINGVDGASAYDIAVTEGYAGSLTEWLASLVGGTGKSAFEIAQDNGYTGDEAQWVASLQGQAGRDGIDGINGVDGASAYDIAVANGYTGSATEWIASLEGATGQSAFEIAQANGYNGSEQDWLNSLIGAQGARGPRGFDGAKGADGTNGIDGVNGLTAYELAQQADPSFDMSLTEWLDSLAGDTGKSAYEIAVDNGLDPNAFSEQQWLESLQGASAYDLAVANGYVGDVSSWLESLVGEQGKTGEAGKSAYEIARDAVLAQDGEFTLTELEWAQSLAGQDGASAFEIAQNNGYQGTVEEWLVSLKGARGETGQEGAAGKSAYEIARDNGYLGDEQEWLASLQGQDVDPDTLTEITEDITGLEGDVDDILGQLRTLGEQLTTAIEGGTSTAEALGTLEATINSLSGQINTLSTEEIAEINTAVEGIQDTIEGFDFATSAELDAVAAIFGKPASDVTANDLAIVDQLIAEQDALEEGQTYDFDPVQIQLYDVNNDGVIDQTDRDFLAANDAQTGATGFYDVLSDIQTTQADTQRQQEILNAAILKRQAEDDARRAAEEEAAMRMYAQALMGQEGRRVTTTPGKIADIDYLYDFSSIFANPAQEGMFASPFATPQQTLPVAAAEGGLVEDLEDAAKQTDDLMKLLGI